MSFVQLYSDLLSSFIGGFKTLFSFWWLWLPFFLFFMLRTVALNYSRTTYKNSIKWILLEVRVPRALIIGPKAMEQFYANLHGFRNEPSNWLEKYRDGEVPLWFSFELVSLEGEIHFYIKTPEKLRKAVEANLYAQYPDIEIIETEDYMKKFSPTLEGLYNQGYNFWGTELLLDKDNSYPIRTYKEFESADEFANLDPISALLEVLKKTEKGENILIEMLIRPSTDEWQKKGEEFVKELKRKNKIIAKKERGEEEEYSPRTPGETEELKAVENKLLKPGFDTLIRYVYIAERSVFSATFARRGILSTFNQYGSKKLNVFRHNFKAWTMVQWVYYPYIFPKRRAEGRKARMLLNYRERRMPEDDYFGMLFNSSPLSWDFSRKVSTLNVEELATIYHYPTETVLTAPLIGRVESKKIGPPAELPIFGDEDESGILMP